VPAPYVQGGLRTRASKGGTPVKSGYFTDICASSVKTVADRHRLPYAINRIITVITSTDDELFSGIDIDDFDLL